MTRLHLILACVLSAVSTSTAFGQFPTLWGGTAATGTQRDASSGAPQDMYSAAAQYHDGAPPPPPRKLPKGVVAEDGLLFYNGRPYGDVGYQQLPGNPYPQLPPAGPVQLAAYSTAMQPASAPDGSMAYGYPGSAAAEPMGVSAASDCANCEPGACGPHCSRCHGRCNDPGCLGWLAALLSCNGKVFPGKLGWNWIASGDVVFMTREAATNRVLVLDNITLEPLLRANDIGFRYEEGGRAMVGLMGPSGITYQATYLAVSSLHDQKTIIGDNNLTIPDPLGAVTVDFSSADMMRYTYASRLQTAEANVIYPWGSFNLLFGYRWLEVREFSQIQATDLFDGATSDFDVTCSNQLNGGQIGLLGEWEMWSIVNFDFWAKWGVFGNLAAEHQVLRDIDNTVLVRDARGRDSKVAFVSELGANLVVPLGAMFHFQVGYSVFFINNLALAPNQFDFEDVADSGTHVQFGGDVILHGINAGFTANW